MTPDDTSTHAPAVAAQPRAVRLVPKPVPPPATRAPLPAASSYSAPASLPAREERSAVERKLAGLYDATDMLRVLDTEVALQRARRLHGGGGSRQTLRVAAIALFFTLFIAALAAMSYLQSRLAERGFSRHRAAAEATANPPPAPSMPPAATRARPAGSAR